MRNLLAILGIVAFGIVLSVLLTGRRDMKAGPEPYNPGGAESTSSPANAAKATPVTGIQTVIMTFKGKGDVTITLDPKDAPQTVAEFVRLVKGKYYDRIKVHRYEGGESGLYLVQMGDPGTKNYTSDQLVKMGSAGIQQAGIGGGGSGQNVPFEENGLKHDAYTIGMALKSARSATGDGQIYINTKANHDLDGNYCIFGRVTQGQNVVDQLRLGDEIVSARVK